MSKIRAYFLSVIYIVLLVELANNLGKINTETQISNNKKINKAVNTLKEKHRKIKEKNEEKIKLNKKNKDFEKIKKIIEICKKEKEIIEKIEKIKEEIILKSGGYNKKNKIAKPTNKNNIKNLSKKTQEDIVFIYENYKKYSPQKKINFENNKKLKLKIDDENNGELKINDENNGELKIDDENNGELKINDENNGELKINNENNGELKINNENNNELKIDNKNNLKKNTFKNAFEKNLTIFKKNLTIIEVINMLSNKQLSLLIKNEVLLDSLISEISASKTSFDTFDIIVKPKKEKIMLGQDFEADIFLTTHNSDTNPIIKVNDKNIDFKNGVGKIKIKPSENNIKFDKNGESEQKINIEFYQKEPNSGKDILLKKQIKYNITKKSNIEGQHSYIEFLYKYCDNKYVLKNLAPEINTDISFSFKGGKYNFINKEGDVFNITLFPEEKECYLDIYNKKTKIDTINFNVIDVKIPNINIAFNGKIVAENNFLNPNDDINDVYINIYPDEDFKNKYPDESFYKIKHFSIIFYKKKRIIHSIENKNTDYHSFSEEEKSLLKEADKIGIKITEISREFFNKTKTEIREKNIFKDGKYISRFFNILKNKKTNEDD